MSFMKYQFQSWMLLLVLFIIASCTPQEPASPLPTPTESSQAPSDQIRPSTAPATTEVPPITQSQFADVLSIQVTGNPGLYQFAVEVASPDTGCEQYADWWEVFSEDGELRYRRILLHSHVNEQPFVRSGGPVNIAADDVVYVRAHMNEIGYGGTLMKGTVQDGFIPAEAEAGFGASLERVPPLPEDCAF